MPKPPAWEEAAKDPTDIPVPLLRSDCPLLLYKQIFSEWNSRAVVVWTSGQGIALLAAQETQLPGLGFVLNQPHHDVVRYWLDCACAKTVVEARHLYMFNSPGYAFVGEGGRRRWPRGRRRCPRRRRR